MDGVSAVASVIAIGGAAVDIVQSVKKLHDYWQAIQDAPDDFRSIRDDLAYLLSLLSKSSLRDNTDGELDAILENCMRKVENLVALTEDLEPGFASLSKRARKWSAIKMIFRESKMKKIRESLNDTKSTILLAHQIASDQMINQQFKLQRHNLEAISKAVIHQSLTQAARVLSTPRDGEEEIKDNLILLHREVESIKEIMWSQDYGNDKQHSYGWEPIRTTQSSKNRKNLRSNNAIHFQGVLGQIAIWSRTIENIGPGYEAEVVENLSGRGRLEFDTRIVVHPSSTVARYFTDRGFSIIIRRTQRNRLNMQLSTFRAVPDDALIFEFCRTGNVKGIQTLFSRGEASAYDTNTDGFSPLHFAAYYGHPEICKLLLQEGANEDAVTYRFNCTYNQRRSPLVMATTFEKGISIQPRSRIDTIRLLLHDADVLDDLSDGWELLWGTLSREWLATNNEYYVSEWILRFYSLELRNNPSPFRVAWLLISLMHSEKTHLMQILLGTGVDISHAIYNDLGFSPVHGIVAEGLPLAAIPSLKLMAESGVDLHLAGRTDGFRSNGISPLETPTSVAMRRSQTFSRWQTFLKELMGYDLSEFAAKELEISPLVDAGWNRETLTSLLELKFEPAPLKQAICICGREVHQLYREEEQWWMELLNQVKNGLKPLAGDLQVKKAPFEESENLCWICSEEGMARGGQWSPSAARPTTS